MVSAQPAPTGPGAARDAEPEATRPRRLLRGDGELLLVEPYASDRGAHPAEVAFAAQLERLLRLDDPCCRLRIPLHQHGSSTQCTGACEPLAGRAGCSKRARPDL